MSDEEDQWREAISKRPIRSCGRLDLATFTPDEETVGRVTSDRIRYVYFEDGTEVVVLGEYADDVAFRAVEHSRLSSDTNAIAARNRRAPVTPIPVSEPPGDGDIVLLCRIDGDSFREWAFDAGAVIWEAVAHYDWAEWGATHYLLLRKGE